VRFTIERLRTLVLVTAVLLLVALVGFLVIGKWRNPFSMRDLPKKLGLDIQQEADGVTFSHALGGHAQFKVHASKVVQLRQGNALLHDVKIEIYGEDGKRVDRIEGNEFEYDQKKGLATAAGPVEITLVRPGTAPAMAPKATVTAGKDKSLNAAARAAARGQVHVKTSGLTFDMKSGVAMTNARVDFDTVQGKGSALGSVYDSKQGHLVLNQAVELRAERSGGEVTLHAAHAEFERSQMICNLRAATAVYRAGQAAAGEAQISFRDDGSAKRLDATHGFTMTTATGSKVQSASGVLDFDEHNQPKHGHLEGAVRLESQRGGHQTHGAAQTADLEFAAGGELRRAHLVRDVEIRSDEQSVSAHASRLWRSPVADIAFRRIAKGQVEPATLAGVGGVVVESQSQRGKETAAFARLRADQMNGEFAPGSSLRSMTGTGHAAMEQTTAAGAHQTATGDRLTVRLSAGATGAAQVESAVLDGKVLLTQQAVAHAGATPLPMKATAGRADYASQGQWLHLTANPRVEQGGMQMTADKIDLSQDSGDAFAHGNVKASWLDAGKQGKGASISMLGSSQEPMHAVAAEAQMHQAPGNGESVVSFRGHARLWQQANSVAAPVIVLHRVQQTLEAHSTDRNEPVRVVFLNTDRKAAGKNGTQAPAVMRVRGGDLYYAEARRTALMQNGTLGPVVAETGTATTQSNAVELKLTPAGTAATHESGMGQVEHMTARGRVVVSSQGRRGTGEQLDYTGLSGEYVLTGTAAAPPRLTDPERGSTTGAALIFHSRDDSVSIEGRGRPTTTKTMAPR
jgi:lipopolysaccharide export system protein LptA